MHTPEIKFSLMNFSVDTKNPGKPGLISTVTLLRECCEITGSRCFHYFLPI